MGRLAATPLPDVHLETVEAVLLASKRTGDVCEVSHEVMKFLRREEKRMRRELEQSACGNGNLLSLDSVPCQGEESVWLKDNRKYEDDVLTEMNDEAFCALLTGKQLEVFSACIQGGMTPTEYSRFKVISRQSVNDTITQIRKKAKKHFA